MDRRIIDRISHAAVLIFFLLGATPVLAQISSQATLEGWEDRVQRMIGDRYHAIGGIFYDRGLFRPLTPEMDAEYLIDESTAMFSPAEDSRFYSSRYGFRFYAASINKSQFITYGHFRTSVPVGEKHSFLFEGVQQEDLRVKRFLINLGYAYSLARNHRAGGTVSGGEYKPDIDLAFHYQYGSRTSGMVRIEYKMLDVANNFIFDTIGVDKVLEDTTRSYSPNPRLFSARLFSPIWKNMRVELVAGHQTPGRAVVSSLNHPDTTFYWDDSSGYFGALFEVRISAAVSLGLSQNNISNQIQRDSPTGSAFTSDYSSSQWSRATGFFALGTYRRLQGELWFTSTTSSDVQTGKDFDQASIREGFEYIRKESLLTARIRHVPVDRGLRAGLELRLHSLDESKDVEVINRYRMFEHTPKNDRATVLFGYQFRCDSYFEFGTSYDFDGDQKSQRFDGAFLRMMFLW